MATFVSFGEVMIRDSAADCERLERTRQVWISPAGSEFSVAVGLSRLGIPSRFITRLPDNSYGRMVERIAREQGLDTAGLIWASPTEPIGRYLYEPAVFPRAGVGTYQRMFSAASRLEPSAVDWPAMMSAAQLLHVSGITFGLAAHSGYRTNYLAECFSAARKARPAGCLTGLDFNYRTSLWAKEPALKVLEPVVAEETDILIASLEDLESFFGFPAANLHGADGAIDERRLNLEELAPLAGQVFARFDISLLALTKRFDLQNGSSRTHSFCFARSGAAASIERPRDYSVVDRLGGGDAWCAGLYYGLLTQGRDQAGLAAAVKFADAALRLQQTLMFDLPIISLSEIEELASGVESTRVRR